MLREPGTRDVAGYGARVRRLAAIYALLFVLTVFGMVLLGWHGRYFLTLTQRTNVETLVLAFFLVFFAYLAVLSWPGFRGALRLAGHAVYGTLLGWPALEVQKAKQRAASRAGIGSTTAALNVSLRRAERPGEAFELAVADRVGGLGVLRVNGARLQHCDGPGHGSNDLLLYFVHQVAEICRGRGLDREIEVVSWKTIDDEETEQYLSMVGFATRLEQALGKEALWPTVTLTDRDCAELQRRVESLCPALRDEALLPDWEFRGEHKIPIVPEPLGLVSLSRSERRVDPVASMAGAVAIVFAVDALLLFLRLRPPWVPG